MSTKIIIKKEERAMHMLMLTQLGRLKAGSSAGFHNHINN
jgi:hypothetical protein